MVRAKGFKISVSSRRLRDNFSLSVRQKTVLQSFVDLSAFLLSFSDSNFNIYSSFCSVLKVLPTGLLSAILFSIFAPFFRKQSTALGPGTYNGRLPRLGLVTATVFNTPYFCTFYLQITVVNGSVAHWLGISYQATIKGEALYQTLRKNSLELIELSSIKQVSSVWLCSCSNAGSIRDDPYRTSRKNST